MAPVEETSVQSFHRHNITYYPTVEACSNRESHRTQADITNAKWYHVISGADLYSVKAW
jgi:hypothetical protein